MTWFPKIFKIITVIGFALYIWACNSSPADISKVNDSTALQGETTVAVDPVHFVEEVVHIGIQENGHFMEVTGDYVFKNSSAKDVIRRIFFPFKIDELHPRPSKVFVSTGKATLARDGVIFPLKMKSKERKKIRISFLQEVNDNNATYIVKSALTWGKPLETATFLLSLPAALSLQHSAFPLRKLVSNKAQQLWYFQTTNFVPRNDFAIQWK